MLLRHVWYRFELELLAGGDPILLGYFWYRVELPLLAGAGGPILLGHFWNGVELGGTACCGVMCSSETFGIGSSWHCLLEGRGFYITSKLGIPSSWHCLQEGVLYDLLYTHFWFRVELGGTAC